MAKETERRFLVKSDEWRSSANGGVHYLQGYLTTDPEQNVPIRIGDDAASLTIKGEADGFTRPEFGIPFHSTTLRTSRSSALSRSSRRRDIRFSAMVERGKSMSTMGKTEASRGGRRDPLRRGGQARPKAWVGEDISSDERYRNINLVEHPFSRWSDKEKPQERRCSSSTARLSRMVFIASLPSSFPWPSTNYQIRKAPWMLLSMKRAKI